MTNNPPITLSRFLRQCYQPADFTQSILTMRVKDRFVLGLLLIDYQHPTRGSLTTYAQAYIVRQNHGWQYQGLWTLITRARRPDIWTQGAFTINPATLIIEFNDVEYSRHNFIRICRYFSVLAKHPNHQDNTPYINQGLPLFYTGVCIDQSLEIKDSPTHRNHDSTQQHRFIDNPLCEQPLSAIMAKSIWLGHQSQSHIQ